MAIRWTLGSSQIQRKWIPISIVRKRIPCLLTRKMSEYYDFTSKEFKCIIKIYDLGYWRVLWQGLTR